MAITSLLWTALCSRLPRLRRQNPLSPFYFRHVSDESEDKKDKPLDPFDPEVIARSNRAILVGLQRPDDTRAHV